MIFRASKVNDSSLKSLRPKLIIVPAEIGGTEGFSGAVGRCRIGDWSSGRAASKMVGGERDGVGSVDGLLNGVDSGEKGEMLDIKGVQSITWFFLGDVKRDFSKCTIRGDEGFRHDWKVSRRVLTLSTRPVQL